MQSPGSGARRLQAPRVLVALIAIEVCAIGIAWAADDRPSRDVLTKGAELFEREWLPATPGAPGPDGLGPVYNETSCIACHHQGGPGGAGPTSTNVEILSTRARRGADAPAEVHPGFRDANSVMLHRFGVHPVYKEWRLKLLGNKNIATMAESVETEIKQLQMIEDPLARATTRGFPLDNGLLRSERKRRPSSAWVSSMRWRTTSC
jgi:hypothetical protein